jgi:hypothetical protein
MQATMAIRPMAAGTTTNVTTSCEEMPYSSVLR